MRPLHARSDALSPQQLLRGECLFFGNPVAAAWELARTGQAHPRVARYEAARRVLLHTAHRHLVRAHHNGQVAKLREAASVFNEGPPNEPLADKLARLAERRAAGGGALK